MEKIVSTARAHDKNVIGCKKHNADIMISLQFKDEKDIRDFFFSQELAEKLCVELRKQLDYNKK